MRKTIIAGNWKMNKTNVEALKMLKELKPLVHNISDIEIIIGAPFTALSDMVKEVSDTHDGFKNIKIAAENVYPQNEGAYTGEISPVMLKSIGVEYVILGHSERREYFKESDEFINQKVKSVLSHGMKPILCIGEKLDERESGKTKEININQLRAGLSGITKEDAKNIIIAYEPVWAIGTGKTATPEMAQETHFEIRKELINLFGDIGNDIVIQYGGSMKPDNAKELISQPDIDGGLIGGASLEAQSFFKLIEEARMAKKI